MEPNTQPFISRVTSARVSDRAVTETIGICRGILADGVVELGEARMLLDWLERNPDAQGWPFSALLPRLRAMLEDGRLDGEEEKELLETLMQLTGDGFAGIGNNFVSNSSTLPLDRPEPTIEWRGNGFVFTGTMACGSRKACQEAIQALGGVALPGVSSKMSYLVIGSIGSEAWIHSTHGRKIEQAVELRDQGMRVAIVGEQHWLSQVEAARS